MIDRMDEARLDALTQLNLLDTPPSEAFDRITRMASQLFGLPGAAISLTDADRQWFKSRVGIDYESIPRHKSPCSQVVETQSSVVVPDLLADPWYANSPFARSGVRFYAGAPLRTREGFVLGSMCVLGMHPREATADEIGSLADLAAMVMAQIELQSAFGRIDPSTGMPNRTQFIDDLEDLARDRKGGERRLAILVDLASAEQISSAARVMGSSFVEDLVTEGARNVRTILSAGRQTYHVSPTQFVFLAPPEIEETQYVERLKNSLGEIRNTANSRFVTTTGIGVAPFELGAVSPRDVLRIAHGAAQDGRAAESQVSVYSSTLDASHQRRFVLLSEFGTSLEGSNKAASDQLSLVYQPRIDLASGGCVSAEALLRWKHPTLGDVAPGEFMPLVEQTAMAREATAWVLKTAFAQQAAWRKAGVDVIMSVNLSSTNLIERDLPQRVADGLAAHGLTPDCLELEVTESAIMDDAGQALGVLEDLANSGIRLAIDDFGTGYSSLAYLQRLPAHVVKIDQSFILDLATDERRRTLVTMMISLCHDLGYRVVAEGVETRQALEILEAAGCDEVQGFYFGRPMKPEAFVTWRQMWKGTRVLSTVN